VLEELSLQHLKSILPPEWICREEHEDYGLDVRVELVAQEDVTALEFSVQLKATDHLKTSGGDVVHRCKVSTAAYFLRRPEPVMYVVYDAQGGEAYWLWVKPYLEGLDESRPGWREQETVGIRIPRLNVLSLASVEEIARYVQAWWAEVVPRVGAGDVSLPAAGEIPRPGGLPPGSRLPFTRNELFTGREVPLKALALALLYDQHISALATQAVAGMGGVGKTQLAVEFAYRYGRFFYGVHWLNAGSPAGLGAEVAACGAAMGLEPWPKEQPEQVARTLDAWRRGGPRLVVLDNLEEVEPAREWLGRLSGGGARVLVTARRQDWPRDLGLDPLRLEVFSEEESLAFLREYLGEERATEAELGELAERLGHLPLALELAGRYLGGLARLTVGEYLERIEDVCGHPSMADWRAELGNPTGHDLDLAKTFAASWERVEDETAREVFLIVGWCAPNQAVPWEVLERAAPSAGSGQVLDREACDAAVGVLAGLGLVEVEDPQAGPLVHPLLGEFARALAGAGEGLAAVTGALVQMARRANAQMDETGSPSHFEPLLPHVRTVAEAGGTEAPPDDGSLWVNLDYYLDRVADYAGARAACERGVRLGEKVYGRDHQEVALRVNNLGGVLRAQGDLAGARGCFERALGIDERVYGPDHPAVARDVNNLGNVLQAQGDLAGARGCFERALGIDERVYGLEHPNNLGGVLQDLGDLAGARGCYERALGIDERVYGPEHPAVAIRVNNLGTVLWDQGDLAGARGCYERALGIDERVYGPEHPNVAIRVNNLGSVLRAQGDLAGARGCYERALGILEKSLPASHPYIRIARRNLESLGK